jgi:hypothetical protein
MTAPARSWCLQHRALPPHAQHAARVPGGIGRVVGCTTLAGDVVGWTVLIGGVTRQFVPRDVVPMRRLALVSETPNGAA